MDLYSAIVATMILLPFSILALIYVMREVRGGDMDKLFASMIALYVLAGNAILLPVFWGMALQ